MTNTSQRESLEKLGFKLTDSSHNGIYQHETFENEFIKFILVLDKACFECYIYGNQTNPKRAAIIDILREIKNDVDYLENELSQRHFASRLIPSFCIKILTDHYEEILKYFSTDG